MKITIKTRKNRADGSSAHIKEYVATTNVTTAEYINKAKDSLMKQINADRQNNDLSVYEPIEIIDISFED